MVRTSRPRALTLSVPFVLAAVAACAAAACDDDTTPASSTTDASTTASDSATSSDAGSGNDATSGDGATATDSGGGTDAGSDGATDAGADTGATTSGPYALVYSGTFNGIDTRNVTATLSGAGGLLGYTFSANEAPVVLTAQVADITADAFSNIGRWSNGTVGGPFYDDGGVKTLSATEAQHYGLAREKPVFPASGTANYTMIGATKPSIHDGTKALGTVTAGSLTARFGGTGATAVGFSLTITMEDGTFNVVGNGGPSAIADAGLPFTFGDAGFYFAAPSMAVTTDAGACASGTCASSGSRIAFAGPNLERVVLAYVFGPGSLTGARRGVVVFQKQ